MTENEIALEAMERRPEVFERLDVTIFRSSDEIAGGIPRPPDEFPMVEMAPWEELAFADRVVTTLIEADLSVETTAGAPAKSFPGEAVEDAVRRWKLRETHTPPTSQNAIAAATMLSRPVIRRIVRLVAVNALDWDERRGKGWLGINGLFRATPSRISLRELEKAHGLEPLA